LIDLEYSWFKKKVHEIAGIDLDSYKPDQMKRLLTKALDKSGARNYVEFVKLLEKSPAKIQAFRDSVTINVSSLFRDAQRWNELKKHLPNLVTESAPVKPGGFEKRSLRIWSAGCSIGAEPYTLAILMEELTASAATPKFNYDILCTDIDSTMLHRAREGVFTDTETKEVPPEYMAKYFQAIERPTADWAVKSIATTFYETAPNLRTKMKFIIHNLLSETWEKNFNLIVCRNVLIYFNNDIKERLFSKFHDSLLDGGLLFIGGTEVMFSSADIGFKSLSTGIYKRIKES
jgi:chemotaxis protein methyltransferase CheR